ncbi:MAG: pyridoxal-phosphate dependent enzyme [Silvanigrellaceae bacterium]
MTKPLSRWNYSQLSGIDDVHVAARRIEAFVHQTPVLTSRSLDEHVGHQVFLKCENLQKVGAFKFRGACNAVFALSDEEAKNGVIAHSSGNHAQALALAARMRGIPAYIVMPSNAPQVKKDAVAGYGGIITFCEPTLQAREATQELIVCKTGARVVHPYDNDFVIAGQGTAALELVGEVPDLDIVMAPVGGGGLLSGTGIVVSAHRPHAKTIGVEPDAADDAARSMAIGQIVPSENPKTIADGLLTSLGERNFEIINDTVDSIVTVSEESIVAAMKFIWERCKLIIEPSAAVPIAALFERRVDTGSRRIGIILSGGNVDLNLLPWQPHP